MTSIHKLLTALLLLVPAGGLLLASQGQGQFSQEEFPSKVEACGACTKNKCPGKCYGVICPAGCSINPPAMGDDSQWFCAAINASPWPGVRAVDECGTPGMPLPVPR